MTSFQATCLVIWFGLLVNLGWASYQAQRKLKVMDIRLACIKILEQTPELLTPRAVCAYLNHNFPCNPSNKDIDLYIENWLRQCENES